jgi:hypothetical protein
MANVVIDIATEFTGKKGFKQAETATDKLTKNVKESSKKLWRGLWYCRCFELCKDIY